MNPSRKSSLPSPATHTPFHSSPNRIPRRLKAFSAATIAFGLLVATAYLAAAGSFAGRWVGYYTNSTGEKGSDSLVLSEGADGTLAGTWSGNIPIRGRRLNANTAEMHGRTATRAYQMTLTEGHGSMIIKYTATRLDSRGSYSGVVDLSRQ